MFKIYTIVFAMSCGVLYASSAQAQAFSATNKSVTVYTTAKNSDYRISKTETLKFEDKAQPFETEICVFVDPNKTFQTMLGIGSALTDAAAETFYKLPKDKQKEFLTAFYDREKG